MLEHTLDRAAQLASEARTITIVSSEHTRWSHALDGHRGQRIVQPRNRDTGPGVYLPLAYVRARDPEAIVYILPSDHYIRPGERFVELVRRAGDLAAEQPDRIVLTGVTPEEPDSEYGYIDLGPPSDDGVRSVKGFVEKPALPDAADAVARGALWNTMVIAASVRALWDAAREAAPGMIARFDVLAQVIDTPWEQPTLDTIYDRMPLVNFSRDVLERATDRCVAMPLDGVEWSDWGRADRIEATLARRPAVQRPLRATGHALGGLSNHSRIA